MLEDLMGMGMVLMGVLRDSMYHADPAETVRHSMYHADPAGTVTVAMRSNI